MVSGPSVTNITFMDLCPGGNVSKPWSGWCRQKWCACVCLCACMWCLQLFFLRLLHYYCYYYYYYCSPTYIYSPMWKERTFWSVLRGPQEDCSAFHILSYGWIFSFLPLFPTPCIFGVQSAFMFVIWPTPPWTENKHHCIWIVGGRRKWVVFSLFTGDSSGTCGSYLKQSNCQLICYFNNPNSVWLVSSNRCATVGTLPRGFF